MSASNKMVAIVTGSSKGVGYATVRGLAKHFNGDIFLTARSEQRGLAAVKQLSEVDNLTAHFHQLDIDDTASIKTLRDFMKENYGGIDILVNNAGIKFASSAKESIGIQADVTIKTNYFSVKNTCDILFPILKPGARVVNVSSTAGWLPLTFNGLDDKLKFKFGSSGKSLSYEALDSLMQQFVSDCKAGDHVEKGWPFNPYVVSKLAVSALTRIQQQELDKKQSAMVVSHVDPGHVATDMTANRGSLTPDQGAVSSIYAALLPPKTSLKCRFFMVDCSERDWITGKCMTWKVAVVTGANKGIGLGIVKELSGRLNGDVYLTARDIARGQAAVKAVNRGNVFFHQLDIDDPVSIGRLKDFMKAKYGGIDILINNAGMKCTKDAPETPAEQAELTIKTNFFSLKNTCDILFPILNPGARVVNITSSSSWLGNVGNTFLKNQFGCPTLSVPELESYMHEYISDVSAGTAAANGWLSSPYRVSKLGVSALTRIQQKELVNDIVVNHVHPGWVATDLTGFGGPWTSDEGAVAPVFAALLPPRTEVRGGFVRTGTGSMGRRLIMNESFQKQGCQFVSLLEAK